MPDTLNKLRTAFARLQTNGAYALTRESWRAAVQALLPENPTPEDWIDAAKRLKIKCPVCHGSGVYLYGTCVNGQMSKSGPCYRCESKGYQNFRDFARNKYYDEHRSISIT